MGIKKRHLVHTGNLKAHRNRRRVRNPRKILANSSYLTSCIDVIYKQYKPEDVSLYRWTHNPITEDDFKPQIFQSVSSMSEDDLSIPDIDAPDEVKLEYASWFTLSNFDTPENAVSAWQNRLDNMLKKCKTPEKKEKEIEKWVKKKGQYVTQINYTKESGLIGPCDDDIHKEFFPFEGANIELLIDKDFPPIKIEIK